MLRTTKYDLDTITRGVITLAILAGLYLLIHRLSGVLLPFLISWVIAYMLDPIVRFFQYKCKLKSRGLSVAVTLLLVLSIIAGIIAIIVPMISKEMSALSGYVSAYLAQFDSSVLADVLPEEMKEQYLAFFANLDLQSLLQNSQVVDLAGKALPKLGSVLSGSFAALANLTVVAICFLYVIFLMLDFEALTGSWSKLIPGKFRQRAEQLIGDLEVGMNSYFRGQALVAGIVGVLFAIGFEIIGLPLGIIVGLFIGLLNMVPYLQVVGLLPCALLGLLQAAETGRPVWLVFLLIGVVFCVVQLTQDMVLVPKIMGNVTGLHPAIILLALSIWGSLLGILGMIIALPMTTLMISYYRRFIADDENATPES